MPARTDKLRLLGDVDNTGRAAGKMLQVDTDDLTHVYVDPLGGGANLVYADAPPADPEVGTVFIDATGYGINPDGTRP